MIERVVDTLRGASGEPSSSPSSCRSRCRRGTNATLRRLVQRDQRLVVALQLSAGVAVPIDALRRAMGACFNDSMLTTERDGATEGYMPITAHGRAVEEEGQRTLVALGPVPNE